MSQPEPPVIELEDVSREFAVSQGIFKRKKKLVAVNGVSMSVRKGEIFALVGESACGKTTLAKMILGLLTPTEGGIKLYGKSIKNMDRLSKTRKIQPIFQDPYSSLNPRKTVGNIISFPLFVHKTRNRRGHRKRTGEMLDLVGLPKRLMDSFPNQLSGGQRQRVAIARALIMRPDVVICDEPTSALDVSVQAQILNLLMELQKELNVTYIFITHDLSVVYHIAKRVAVMYLGRIVEENFTESLFNEPKHPYTKTLLKSILTAEAGKGLPESNLEAGYPDPLNMPSGCCFHPRCPEKTPRCSQVKPVSATKGESRVECLLFNEDRHVKGGDF